MLFTLQPDGPVPIYEQIVAQVIYGVAAGTLEVGTFIPSVRDLAEQLLVHPNTVARAYQDLERRGVIVARRGKGMEVTAPAPRLARQARQEILRGRVRDPDSETPPPPPSCGPWAARRGPSWAGRTSPGSPASASRPSTTVPAIPAWRTPTTSVSTWASWRCARARCDAGSGRVEAAETRGTAAPGPPGPRRGRPPWRRSGRLTAGAGATRTGGWWAADSLAT